MYTCKEGNHTISAQFNNNSPVAFCYILKYTKLSEHWERFSYKFPFSLFFHHPGHYCGSILMHFMHIKKPFRTVALFQSITDSTFDTIITGKCTVGVFCIRPATEFKICHSEERKSQASSCLKRNLGGKTSTDFSSLKFWQFDYLSHLD